MARPPAGIGGNTIYHNDFFSGAEGDSLSNVLDDGYPSGGNYWIGFNGTDLMKGANQDVAGSDGIADTPYVINALNRDNYPLMQPERLVGDVNHDGKVNMTDVATCSAAFGSYSDSYLYASSYPRQQTRNPAADINGDNRIDIEDLARVSANCDKHL
jgi:hypothetical protein